MSATVSLHMESRGDGRPIVLGHGFGGSARNFGPQVRKLHSQFRMLTFDARGHARSQAPVDAANYQPACFVDDIRRVLDQNDVATAVIGGLSMGAANAMRFALHYPERTQGLIVAAPPPGAGRSRRGRNWSEDFANAIDAEGLDAAGERFVWGENSGFDAQAAQFVRQGLLEHAPFAIAHILRELLAKQPDPIEWVEQIRELQIPTLIVVGGADSLSLQVAKNMAAHFPDAQLEIIPDAGHVVNLAAPACFNAALISFLGAAKDCAMPL